MDIQLFIVFHKNIFDKCYCHIPDDILYKYFTFVAVNKNIPKEYTQNKYKVINEWELPIYDNTMQERGYNENSAIYHVYANNLHKNYKYIGFFQYDMVFQDNIIEYIDSIPKVPTCFTYEIFNFKFCTELTWKELDTLKFIVNDYEKFYNKPLNKETAYPLCNTFIIPVESYENIMKWVIQLYDKMYPWCMQPPNASNFGHIGGIYERIMAFAIGGEGLRYVKINVSHDHKYKILTASK